MGFGPPIEGGEGGKSQQKLVKKKSPKGQVQTAGRTPTRAKGRENKKPLFKAGVLFRPGPRVRVITSGGGRYLLAYYGIGATPLQGKSNDRTTNGFSAAWTTFRDWAREGGTPKFR